jgi:hypothetical protein
VKSPQAIADAFSFYFLLERYSFHRPTPLDGASSGL